MTKSIIGHIVGEDHTKEEMESCRIIRAKDVMNTSIGTINSSASAEDTAKKIAYLNLDFIIITKNETPVGIITYKDLVMKIIVNSYPTDMQIEKIMSAPLVHCVPEQPVWEIADLMNARDINKIPVIDEYDELLGTVDIIDLLKVFSLQKK